MLPFCKNFVNGRNEWNEGDDALCPFVSSYGDLSLPTAMNACQRPARATDVFHEPGKRTRQRLVGAGRGYREGGYSRIPRLPSGKLRPAPLRIFKPLIDDETRATCSTHKHSQVRRSFIRARTQVTGTTKAVYRLPFLGDNGKLEYLCAGL